MASIEFDIPLHLTTLIVPMPALHHGLEPIDGLGGLHKLLPRRGGVMPGRW